MHACILRVSVRCQDLNTSGLRYLSLLYMYWFCDTPLIRYSHFPAGWIVIFCMSLVKDTRSIHSILQSTWRPCDQLLLLSGYIYIYSMLLLFWLLSSTAMRVRKHGYTQTHTHIYSVLSIFACRIRIPIVASIFIRNKRGHKRFSFHKKIYYATFFFCPKLIAKQGRSCVFSCKLQYLLIKKIDLQTWRK